MLIEIKFVVVDGVVPANAVDGLLHARLTMIGDGCHRFRPFDINDTKSSSWFRNAGTLSKEN